MSRDDKLICQTLTVDFGSQDSSPPTDADRVVLELSRVHSKMREIDWTLSWVACVLTVIAVCSWLQTCRGPVVISTTPEARR